MSAVFAFDRQVELDERRDILAELTATGWVLERQRFIGTAVVPELETVFTKDYIHHVAGTGQTLLQAFRRSLHLSRVSDQQRQAVDLSQRKITWAFGYDPGDPKGDQTSLPLEVYPE